MSSALMATQAGYAYVYPQWRKMCVRQLTRQLLGGLDAKEEKKKGGEAWSLSSLRVNISDPAVLPEWISRVLIGSGTKQHH